MAQAWLREKFDVQLFIWAKISCLLYRNISNCLCTKIRTLRLHQPPIHSFTYAKLCVWKLCMIEFLNFIIFYCLWWTLAKSFLLLILLQFPGYILWDCIRLLFNDIEGWWGRIWWSWCSSPRGTFCFYYSISGILSFCHCFFIFQGNASFNFKHVKLE